MDPGEIASVLDAIGDGVYVVDTERRIRLWNGGAEQLTGYAASEAIGRWCGDGMLDHVDEAGRNVCGSHCPLLATMADGERREVRVFLHHRDGTMLPVRVQATPLLDGEGRITGAVEVFVDDTDHRMAEHRAAEMSRRAELDSLTGIGNRAFLTRVMSERFRAVHGGGPPFGVLFCDVDHFKRVNDTYGHAVGDRVLQQIATTLSRAIRPGDEVARFGGEEFVVVTGPVDHAGLLALAERLRSLVPGARVATEQGSVSVEVSVGAARVRRGDSATSLLQRADDRLLTAKRSGRNTVVGCASPDRCGQEWSAQATGR